MTFVFGAVTWLDNLLQLIGVVIVFILILVATYYTTKWIGTSGIVQPKTKNISLIESFRINQNKYIQIIKIGSKYYAVGISKDQITYLTELEEEQLDLTIPETRSPANFKDILKKVIK